MRGQIWSLDYTIGFLFFIVVFFIVGTLLARSFLFNDTFDETYISANAASEHILSTGYPTYWREDDVIIAGLLTNGKLSKRKSQRLARIAQDHDSLRSVLNSKQSIAIILRDQNNTIIPIEQNCSIGFLNSQLILHNRSKSIAYYHDDQNTLLATALALNATEYEDFELQTLFNDLHKYELVILEDPNFYNRDELSQQQKADALQVYVEQGGDLLFTGNVNLTEFINTIPTIETTAWPQDNTSLINLTNTIISITSAYALQDIGYTRYTQVAKFSDGTDFISSYSLGNGDVYYIGSLQGIINNTAQALDTYVGSSLTQFATPTTAYCISATPPTSRNLVSIKRLAAYDGSIISVEVLAWQ